jgi:DNA mismatch endonuclease (patch repair protein)
VADKISKEKRSQNMQRIRPRNTKPELFIRSALHKLGFRFRLHCKDMLGKPDIVLPKYRTIIFVDGCFWHRHANCIEASRPKTNSEYWEEKILCNVKRDKKQRSALKNVGWNIVSVWECEINSDYYQNRTLLQSRLGFLLK